MQKTLLTVTDCRTRTTGLLTLAGPVDYGNALKNVNRIVWRQVTVAHEQIEWLRPNAPA